VNEERGKSVARDKTRCWGEMSNDDYGTRATKKGEEENADFSPWRDPGWYMRNE